MPQQIPEPALKKIRRVGKMLNALSAVSPALAGRAAFRIFCTPRRLPVRDNDREFLATAQHFDFHNHGKPAFYKPKVSATGCRTKRWWRQW